MIIQNGGPNLSREEVVLFPFDDYSIPFSYGMRLNLVANKNSGLRDKTKIVLGTGGPDAPDAKLVVYFGSVHRVGDELWMWYLGQGDEERWHERVCLAKSKDGYNWEKPNLGLVEYKGKVDNNLVDLLGVEHHVQIMAVYYDPDDPELERRFKIAFMSDKYDNKMAVAFSADGLRWEESAKNPVSHKFEMCGVTKLNGCYYLNGQGISKTHYPPARKLETLVSYDFENWTKSSCLGFRRDNLPPNPLGHYAHSGEQAHLGAGLWNRGNVIVGFYGMWHGHPANDRRMLTMDLGLVVSVDALHYREPIPDFRIVPSGEDNWVLFPNDLERYFPALMQGQGIENIGDKTLFWYAPWPEQESDGVKVAVWTRDRLGYYESFLGHGEDSHFISAPIDLEGKPARIYLNLDGLSEYSRLSVEIIDERFEPLANYSRDNYVEPVESGLRQRVAWKNGETIEGVDGPLRIRVNFEGIRPEDIKLYAVYLEHSK